MQPTIGRIVHYTLSADDAAQISLRRADFDAYRRTHPARPQPGQPGATGHQAHVGNHVEAGQTYPALVVRTSRSSLVNLQVFLDGNDVYWATSRAEGTEPGTWCWPTHKPATAPQRAGKPTLGRIVGYRGKQGLKAPRAAIIVATTDSLDQRGVAAGHVPALDSDTHTHLWVFTPGEVSGFAEFNVPFDPDTAPGTWSWSLDVQPEPTKGEPAC